jgi:hypothetical protein
MSLLAWPVNFCLISTGTCALANAEENPCLSEWKLLDFSDLEFLPFLYLIRSFWIRARINKSENSLDKVATDLLDKLGKIGPAAAHSRWASHLES